MAKKNLLGQDMDDLLPQKPTSVEALPESVQEQTTNRSVKPNWRFKDEIRLQYQLPEYRGEIKTRTLIPVDSQVHERLKVFSETVDVPITEIVSRVINTFIDQHLKDFETEREQKMMRESKLFK